jgi:Holliday junction resolvasome RuvABC ATP-dependent DNA helicase subunit
LGVPSQTLVKTVEPYLVRIGLVTKDDGGRRLTAAGIRHVRGDITVDVETP